MSAEATDDDARDRWAKLAELERRLETPMVLLAIVWLVLLVVEIGHGTNVVLETAALVIWGLFVVDFVLKLALAPDKRRFLRTNILTIASLVVPALRVFRVAPIIARVAAVSRGVRLVRVVGTLNRGIRAVTGAARRRGVGYVGATTLIVWLGGAAGMLAFERDSAGSAIRSYSDALWWTSMVLTTMGSEAWPRTLEGRVLCVLLALYAFAVFGYVTGSIATYFVGKDTKERDGSVVALREEIAALRRDLSARRWRASRRRTR